MQTNKQSETKTSKQRIRNKQWKTTETNNPMQQPETNPNKTKQNKQQTNHKNMKEIQFFIYKTSQKMIKIMNVSIFL